MKTIALLFSISLSFIVNAGVDIESGSSFFSHKDLHSGFFSIQRAYNSKSSIIHSFGQNQGGEWDSRLKLSSKKVIFTHYGIGKEEVFSKKDKDTWKSKEQREIEVKRSSIVLKYSARKTLVFNKSGRLLRIKRTNKPDIEFKRSKKGLLANIYIDNKKTFEIKYNPNSLISSITSDVAKVSYRYDDKKRLVGVNVDGITRFKYGYKNRNFPFISTIKFKNKVVETYRYGEAKKNHNVIEWEKDKLKNIYEYIDQELKRVVRVRHRKKLINEYSFSYLKKNKQRLAIKTLRNQSSLQSLSFGVDGRALEKYSFGEKTTYKYNNHNKLILKQTPHLKISWKYDTSNRMLSATEESKKLGKWTKENQYKFVYKSNTPSHLFNVNINGSEYELTQISTIDGIETSIKYLTKTILKLTNDSSTGKLLHARVQGVGIISFNPLASGVIKHLKRSGKKDLIKVFEHLMIKTRYEGIL